MFEAHQPAPAFPHTAQGRSWPVRGFANAVEDLLPATASRSSASIVGLNGSFAQGRDNG